GRAEAQKHSFCARLSARLRETMLTSFADFKLIAHLQRTLAEEGYTTPTPIQAQTIAAALEGRDVLGCAQTGTGKTAAFALPIIQRLLETEAPRIAAPQPDQRRK